jgi:hypothetical protein
MDCSEKKTPDDIIEARFHEPVQRLRAVAGRLPKGL